MNAGRFLHKREGRDLAHAEIHVHAIAFAVGVHEVEGRSRGAAEPAHMLDVSVARQNADERFLVLLENPVMTAGLHAIEVGGDGKHRENDVLARDGEIVHERDVGCFEPLFTPRLPFLSATQNATSLVTKPPAS